MFDVFMLGYFTGALIMFIGCQLAIRNHHRRS